MRERSRPPIKRILLIGVLLLLTVTVVGSVLLWGRVAAFNETVSTEPLLPIGDGPSNRYTNEVEVTIPEGRGWVLFHAKSDGDLDPLHPGKNAFAVSNPVWFE